MAQEFDLVIKALAEQYPADFVKLVREKDIPAEKVCRVEKEVVAVKRESDILYQITEEGYDYLMALEIQTHPDINISRRLLEYTVMQHRKFNKPVYPVVVNLTGRPQVDNYSFECLELKVVDFSYRLINLADLSGRRFLQRCPMGLIPLVPLMQHEVPVEEVLMECIKRIEMVPVEMQSDLYLGLALFSSIRLSRELILRYIEVNKMENSALFDGIRDKWIDQGIQQGKREERIAAILEALQENVGQYPDGLADMLSNIRDFDNLKALLRKAMKVKDLQEFLMALDEAMQVRN